MSNHVTQVSAKEKEVVNTTLNLDLSPGDAQNMTPEQIEHQNETIATGSLETLPEDKISKNESEKTPTSLPKSLKQLWSPESQPTTSAKETEVVAAAIEKENEETATDILGEILASIEAAEKSEPPQSLEQENKTQPQDQDISKAESVSAQENTPPSPTPEEIINRIREQITQITATNNQENQTVIDEEFTVETQAAPKTNLFIKIRVFIKDKSTALVQLLIKKNPFNKTKQSSNNSAQPFLRHFSEKNEKKS